ncbi:phosphonate metabolism protein/1,5-bisphosphokinase (PRPP-forming) PhnN [Aureimonas sp. AU12]|uniref:phosphonate metabolism protein/1,5-bisphosphokinase (PRPP-forming) PhnN n=1 Tax=Aureimonas sp. AU12 TaxID=1638161 RepID=UPI0007811F1C|nr:phosphonate metabolism protein/1,5-bisphosphokinase (PRPP-forming) PhnN [Aureimonas sp. AU12]
MSPEALAPAPASSAPGRGVLVAVVGPSGAGKDTLIAGAAECLRADPLLRVARRVVTRQALAASEDHASLDDEAFCAALGKGAFCLDWQAHGLRYALPRSVKDEVERGFVVIANLSRRSLGEAARRFAALRIVEVSADPDLLAARIADRGREGAQAVSARVTRQVPLEIPPGVPPALRIDNSGDVETAIAELVGFLRHVRADLPA